MRRRVQWITAIEKLVVCNSASVGALITGAALPIRSLSFGHFNRFPQQQPFELLEELVCFSAAQLGIDPDLIELYRKRQPTISEHQQSIADYLRLHPFGDAETSQHANAP
jgi:hypothetical protein